jgi:integrase
MPNKREYLNEKCKLLRLAKNTDLFNPQAVIDHTATLRTKNNKPITTGHRKHILQTYSRFCKDNQIPFDMPKINVEPKAQIIPTTKQVNSIIGCTEPKYTLIYTIMTETAVEGEELHITHRNSIDTQQGKLAITGVKGHSNRVYTLKPQTAEMLRQYLAKHPEPYPFPTSRAMGEAWIRARKQAVKKFCEPDLTSIPMKNLRNYAGALFYKTKGKDPWATMHFMRHKKIETTQHYLEKMVITEENEEYTHRTIQTGTPTTIKEIEELADDGYQYFNEADGYKIFRKHK